MSEPGFKPLGFIERDPDEMAARARDFRALMARRRTVRDFSDRPVPQSLIEDCVMTAASAPSGANQQPWHFAMIANPVVKSRIREAVGLDSAQVFVVACPKDVTMYRDAVKTTGHEDRIVVKDLIELVHEAL